MDTLASYFAMGGYGPFIWGSYGLVAAVLIGLSAQTASSLRRARAVLRQLDGEGDDA